VRGEAPISPLKGIWHRKKGIWTRESLVRVTRIAATTSLYSRPVADLLDYRERFPILAETTYLINHSLGAMPAAAEERLLEYAHDWKTRGIRAWDEGWWEMSLTVGDQIARLIGAPPGTVSMHQNVTLAEGVVLSCFGFDGPRRRIVYEEGNFPSVRYLYQAQRGADIVVAADDEGVVDAIDERTLLVPVTHVLYKTGEIQDVEAIVERAHEHGALVVLDAYQSVGTVPLDVTALGVDFAVGGSVKWLCGGPGAGWLYVRPDLASSLEPALTGWQAHARPFAFEPEQDYAEGAARFLTGTPNVPALYAATAGYDVIEEVGVEQIRARSVEQTALLVELLEEAGFPIGSPRDPARRGGTVVVRPPGFERVDEELAARGILCDSRPDVGLRLGPHFFNTDDELRYAVEQIAEIAGSRIARTPS
jgi:kynureninase